VGAAATDSIQNKVAGERIEWNFDQNSDQNKVFKKEMCRSKESLIKKATIWVRANVPFRVPKAAQRRKHCVGWSLPRYA
jgi:hypothetical protein